MLDRFDYWILKRREGWIQSQIIKRPMNNHIIKMLLVGSDSGSLGDFPRILEPYQNILVTSVDSGSKALDTIRSENINLVIADEQLTDTTGVEFIEALVTVNPLINCALVSSMSAKEFHQETEGLGILTQLPVQFGKKEMEDLITVLDKILDQTA